MAPRLWRADSTIGCSSRASYAPGSLWLAPDRDAGLALAGELRFIPVGIAMFEFESRHLGHYVHFRGPDVAVGSTTAAVR